MREELIASTRERLLSQGRCPGCGVLLTEGVWARSAVGRYEVVCQCGRVYAYDRVTKRYHQGLF